LTDHLHTDLFAYNCEE